MLATKQLTMWKDKMHVSLNLLINFSMPLYVPVKNFSKIKLNLKLQK